MQITASDQRECLGKTSTHTSPGQSSPRGPLAQSERLDAVREGRWKAQIQMEHALLELRQVCEYIPRDLVALLDQVGQAGDELRIFQPRQSISFPHGFLHTT